MTNHDRELARQITKLKKVIRKLVLTSKDFDGLRKMLRDGAFELQVYLVPLVVSQEHMRFHEEELSPELTTEDRAFLKRAGIRFE